MNDNFSEIIVDFYTQNGREFSWRKNDSTPYEILIAELFLKRTTAQAVEKVYPDFIIYFNSFNKIIHSDENVLRDFIRSLGLVNQRTKNLIDISNFIIENYSGIVPKKLSALLKIPGLGEYSSRAILSFAHDLPYGVVDSNVMRVINRIYLNPSESYGLVQVQGIIDNFLPPKKHREFNLGILDFSALLCKPLYPKCVDCPVNVLCNYYQYMKCNDRSMDIQNNQQNVIYQLRKEKGITQAELAKIAGISKRTLINAEKKRTRPTNKTLEKLAKCLDVSIDKLRVD